LSPLRTHRNQWTESATDFQIESANKRRAAKLEKHKAELLRSIEYRHTRRARADAERDLVRLKTMWLHAVKLAVHSKGWYDYWQHREDDLKSARRAFKALIVLQQHWKRRKMAILAKRKSDYEKILSQVVWRLRLWLRCVRRKLAQQQVTRFFHDFGVQRLAFVVSKFRWNVVRLQRFVRSYNRSTIARLNLIRKKWDIIETRVTRVVQAEKRAAEESNRLRNVIDWDASMLDTKQARMPELCQRVNKVTKNARSLSRSIEHALTRAKRLEEKNEHEQTIRKKMQQATMSSAHARKLMEALEDKYVLVPEAEKTMVLKRFLFDRRKEHLRRVNSLVETKLQAAQRMDIEDARGLMDLNMSQLAEKKKNAGKEEKKLKVWGTMLLLTGPSGHELDEIVESAVRQAFVELEPKDDKPDPRLPTQTPSYNYVPLRERRKENR